ncbi:MAG: family 43 glycosylhydrolase [Bacteroidales bacterium]|nr:family 43 glycosylhydrolase [Bacteroidales bacterium]
MIRKLLVFAVSVALGFALSISLRAANPYMPLWEHIPDGEPYIFEDPDHPGEYRVYVYGSHDVLKTAYCGRDQVVWSTSVNDLNHWRYDGVIFEQKVGADGILLQESGLGDILYAPDVVEVVDASGKKTYYLYPNNQSRGRQSMVCKADRPDGPFTVCNWSPDDPKRTVGPLGFDPAILVDDDGRVYGYWGINMSYAAELDPETMATLKEGTEPIVGMVSSVRQPGEFRFFEASSIRKIKDKYVFIYSRTTAEGEFGLPSSNYTLAYAYSNSPLGPYTYGGTIIDGRARDKDADGNTIYTAHPGGNTHGSICEINGQWYVFYHRQVGTNEYSRQAMVAPIEVKVTEGPDGKVEISEGEYNSEGFELDGLNPFERHSAGIACYYTSPAPVGRSFPNFTFPGSYVKAVYPEYDSVADPYDLKYNHNPVINNTAGSVVGYKYFNFNKLRKGLFARRQLCLNLLPQGVDGRIVIMADHPEAARGGIELGTIKLSASMPQEQTELSARLSKVRRLKGKHAIFFVFESDTAEKSLCELQDFVFTKGRAK